MTLITDALDRIARQCSITPPSSWLTSTVTGVVELRDDFLRETVDDLADRLDLPAPIGQQQTLTGTGATNADGSETFSLNADFKRLQRDQLAVYDTLQDRAVVPVTEDGQWNHLTDVGASGAIKHYRIAGYEGNWTMDVYNAPGTGDEIKVSYISTNWMANAAGTLGDTFTAADDVLIFPRRIIEAGTVFRFRERKGLPYQDKYAEYEALVARLSNDTRSRRRIDFGTPDPNVRWQDLIPAFIPSS